MTKDEVENKVSKKVRIAEVNFERRLKEMKPFVMEQAHEYIKKQLDTLSKLLTSHLHGIVK